MCSCGGELTVWCFEHGDWVCDDCGCAECRDEDAWGQEYEDDDWHDSVQHPVWHEGCDDCIARAERIEAEYRAGAR